MNTIVKSKEIGIGVILIILCIILSLNSPVFLTVENIMDILKANTVLAILAIGITLIIITGGIDVSVAAVTTAVAVVIGNLMVALPDHPIALPIIFLVAPLSGILLGLVNGFLISKIQIPPIVTTLGTMSIINGAVLYTTNGVYMNSTNFPKIFMDFARFNLFGISILIYILIVVAVLTWFIMKYTKIGRSIYAIGGNQTSAVRVGINLQSVQFFVYGYMGFLAGIAAIAHTAYIRAVDPNGLLGFELTVIAAVVIGGANILGGSGSIVGTLLGTLLLGVMQNGLVLAHIDTYWQKVIVGVVILVAVSYDHLQKKRFESKLSNIEVR